VKAPLNRGLADASRRTADMPLYTVRNKVTHATVLTTDPGRARITGQWADIGKFKGPILRGMAARAPYFRNGAAATIEEAIDFYDKRFAIGLTAAEKADLAAFLRSLGSALTVEPQVQRGERQTVNRSGHRRQNSTAGRTRRLPRWSRERGVERACGGGMRRDFPRIPSVGAVQNRARRNRAGF
jgi:hypothetical protein